ncbi:MAG: hypothetical protein ACM3ST_14695 [Bdellovibrio bacteriovorus]
MAKTRPVGCHVRHPRAFLVRLGAAIALPLLLAAPAFGAPGQTAFQRQQGSDSITLGYRLEDLEGTTHRLRLSLPLVVLERARGRFKAYDPSELRREADAETLRQMEVAANDLRQHYPEASFEVRPDRSLRWTMGPPAEFAERQRAIYDQRLARAVADLRAQYPQAKIESSDGHFVLQAPDGAQLRRIEQHLLAAQDAANQAVSDHAQQVRSAMERDGQSIRTRIDSDLAAIQEQTRDFAERFIRERLYTLSADGILRPDYARIARLAVDDLASVAPAMRRWTRGMDRRKALGHLLLFVQSIPYDRLDDRKTDVGFLVPPLVLAENRGDCDSKAVTFAALTHLLYPDLPIAMVLLPRHAYLALGLPRAAGDQTLKHDKRVWILAEPAGPGLLPLGRLAAESLAQRDSIEAVVPLLPEQ